MRVGLALLLADETWHLWRELGARFFRDAFYWPMLPESLLPSRPVYTALVAAQLVLAILILDGRWARPALLVASLFQLYVIGSDRNAYHNYRYTFALVMMLMALTPCDRALVVGRPARPGPLWAQRLLQLQLVIIYLASGGSKLVDPDWRSGRVIADGIARFANLAVAKGVPPAAIAFLIGHTVASIVAKLAIATEMTLALGLLSRRWRAPALWLGVMFHLMIEATTTVAIFSLLMILCYGLFASPELEERIVRHRHRRQMQVLHALDWLRRFRFEPGERFAVVTRDGRVTVAAEARAELARATPLLFPLWPLLAIWARARRSRGGH